MAVQTILVAFDGSSGAAAALAWAADLASQTGARLEVVRSWSPLEALGAPGTHDPAALHARESEALAAEVTGLLDRSGARAGTHLVDDLPVPGVLRCATDVGADVIVCGTRGHGRVHEIVLGSVAHGLTLQARVPVVVVPAAAG